MIILERVEDFHLKDTMDDPEPPTLVLTADTPSSTASSIFVSWAVKLASTSAGALNGVQAGLNVIQNFQVHYQKVASQYVQYSPRLPPTASTYNIDSLVADTYYKVCVVMIRNDTSSTPRDCVDASTTSWHIPVSIGSSIGAVLALSIIVLIVLLSRCPSLIRHQRASASESSKYDSMTSSRYPDDHHEFSDTTTHCGHDHDDDVFTSDGCDSHPLDSTCSRHCSFHSHHHYPHYQVPALPERLLCNGNKNHAFVAMGVGGGLISPRNIHRPHGGSLRVKSLSSSGCARSNSLERPRPHRQGSRRAQLMALHSAHQSIQSEPAAPGGVSPRPLHVSISDLPPAVHISDPDAPVGSLVSSAAGAAAAPSSGGGPAAGAGAGAGAGAVGDTTPPVASSTKPKTNLKDTPRTFHMSIDYDV